MTSIIMWMLVGAAVGGHSTPTPLHKFRTEAACLKAADELLKNSRDRRNMVSLNGVCIQVEVYK